MKRLLFALFTIAVITVLTLINIDASAAQSFANATDAPLTRYTYIGEMWVTGYVPGDPAQCGKSDGITASGVPATVGQTAAMKGRAFGTKICIAGLGRYVIEDRGVGYGVVDVACQTNNECYAITGKYQIYIER